MSAEEDLAIQCPYCMVSFSVRVDLTGGESQAFVYDCETCCRPISIEVEIEDGRIVNFNSNAEA